MRLKWEAGERWVIIIFDVFSLLMLSIISCPDIIIFESVPESVPPAPESSREVQSERESPCPERKPWEPKRVREEREMQRWKRGNVQERGRWGRERERSCPPTPRNIKKAEKEQRYAKPYLVRYFVPIIIHIMSIMSSSWCLFDV